MHKSPKQISKLQIQNLKAYEKSLTKFIKERILSKMNVRLIATVGFKILTAVVAGTAVFIGIGQALSGGDSQQKPQQKSGDDKKSSFPPEISNNAPQAPVQEVKRSNTETISAAIRGAGETCGKLFTFAQSLSMVVDAGSRLFKKDNYYSNQPAYYQNGNTFVPVNNPQPFSSGGINWVPNGSYVLQAVPNGNPNRW